LDPRCSKPRVVDRTTPPSIRVPALISRLHVPASVTRKAKSETRTRETGRRLLRRQARRGSPWRDPGARARPSSRIGRSRFGRPRRPIWTICDPKDLRQIEISLPERCQVIGRLPDPNGLPRQMLGFHELGAGRQDPGLALSPEHLRFDIGLIAGFFAHTSKLLRFVQSALVEHSQARRRRHLRIAHQLRRARDPRDPRSRDGDVRHRARVAWKDSRCGPRCPRSRSSDRDGRVAPV
jgi:hypothetical protein